MSRLQDKIALVTGGASGMGEYMVELFVKEGATVIAADVNKEVLTKFKNYDQVVGILLDVSSADSWQEALETVDSQFGRLDILINNAGISSEKLAIDTTKHDWDLMMGINGFGPFLGISHFAPYMAEKGHNPAIVNTSSFTAQIGMGFNTYSASKGAVRALSKAAATEYGRSGVRVNAVFPGIIETPMTKTLEDTKELVNQMIRATPLQRLGQPEDVAHAILFLASDEASFITGAELVIDGGYSAQ